jgi:serine/threonine protein kinase
VIGELLGNYRVVRPLGEGGMGVVYFAEHELLRRPAAVKVLHAELSQSEDLVNRFVREARATAAIRHPGIVEVLDCGFHANGKAYIVMEFLEGRPLRQHLLDSGRLGAVDVAFMGRQIANAVGAAHARGVVHRDLKPDNVFLVGGRLDQVKVLDFGIAKLLGDTAASGAKATRTGLVLGTPAYMSPEQCRGNGAIDHRADIYSLGCVLYEMTCGQLPFPYESTGELIAAHLHDPPQPPRAIQAQLPTELEHLIMSMLSKSPADRPATMHVVATDLARLTNGLHWGPDGGAMPPPSSAPSQSVPLPRTAQLPLPGAPTGGAVPMDGGSPRVLWRPSPPEAVSPPPANPEPPDTPSRADAVVDRLSRRGDSLGPYIDFLIGLLPPRLRPWASAVTVIAAIGLLFALRSHSCGFEHR